MSKKLIPSKEKEIEKRTEELECPFCGADPCEGDVGHAEWEIEEDSAYREFTCPCGALLIVHYDVSFSYVEGVK